MRLKSIKNTSREVVRLILESGITIGLPPNVEIKNVIVTNLNEIRKSVSIIADLAEINEGTGKTKLFD